MKWLAEVLLDLENKTYTRNVSGVKQIIVNNIEGAIVGKNLPNYLLIGIYETSSEASKALDVLSEKMKENWAFARRDEEK